MKPITSPALIKGMFRELAALRKSVSITSASTNGSSQISLTDDLTRSDVGQNSVRFKSIEVSDSVLELNFELDNTCYKCVVTLSESGDGTYTLPDLIEPAQRRKRVRSDLQSLSWQPIVAEVRGQLWRAYGYLKDSDQGFICAAVSCFGDTPAVGDSVVVRAYTQQSQVLSSTALIKDIRSSQTSGRIEILLDCYGEKAPLTRQRSTRAQVATLAFLEIFWPDTNGLRIRVEVLDVTPTGFSAKWVDDQREFPPKGAICRIGTSEVLAQLKWQNEDRIGFDLSLNDRRVLTLWSSWLDEWRLKVLSRTPATRQQSRIASVLLRSGYIRDFKAAAFASTPDLVALIPSNPETRTWLRRFLRGNETELDAHVSFARCTDSGWIIQELGNSAVETRHGELILTDSISSFHSQEAPYLTYGGTMLALFDPISKFNQQFWIKRETLPGVNNYEGRLLNVKAALDHVVSESGTQLDNEIAVTSPSITDWPQQWKALSSWIPERTMFAFGLESHDFACSNLKQAVAHSGYHVERHVALITKGDEQIGLAVAMGVPTFSNLNATSNHLWLILRDMRQWQEVIKSVLLGTQGNSFLGITEAVLVSPGYSSTEIPSDNFDTTFARRRKLQLVPIYLLDEFLKLGRDEP